MRNDSHEREGWEFVREKTDERGRRVRLYRRGVALKRVAICTGFFRFVPRLENGFNGKAYTARFVLIHFGSTNTPGAWSAK